MPVEREALPAAVAAAPAPETAVSAPAAELFPLSGRVVDPEVRPLAGIEVACGDARAPSGANGGFELSVPAGPASVQVADEGLENLFRVRTRVPSQGEVLLVAAPHRALAGTVRDAAGRPIAGARVSLELPLDFRTRFDVPFDAIDLTEWMSATEDDGRFELGRAPLVEGALVRAQLEGYVTASVPAPPFAQADLELVLVPPDLGEWMLAGRVVDPAGAPVAGALVSLGARCATAAADGTFRLDRSDAREATVLWAVHAGRLPAVWQALPDPVTGAPSWPEWIELELGGEPLELAGRVVDQDGAPRPDVLVWIDDPTEFGVLDSDDGAHVEFLCSPVESTYSSGDPYFRSTRTDAQGRFRIQGLLEREYRVGLLHAETLERATSGPHAAGPGELELVLPRPEPAPLEVRLLSRSEQPVAGASIGLNVAIFGGVHHPRSSATTDAEGRVRFEGVAGSPLSLWIRGEGVVPVVQGISRPERGEVVLHVDVLCHFKIDLGDRPELADGVRALDAQGNELILYDLGADGYWSTNVAPLVAGKSVTLGVSETAAELVLELEDVEVRRIPIDLRPGEVQVVTP